MTVNYPVPEMTLDEKIAALETEQTELRARLFEIDTAIAGLLYRREHP